MNNEVALIINDVEYSGWKSVNIKKSLEALSGEFTASVSQKFTNTGIDFVPVNVGDRVEVLVDDERIMKGYIDTRNISYNSDSHEITFSGRDKTADLIDSSLVGNVNINKGYNISTLIRTILNSLGIKNIGITFVNVSDSIYDEDFDCGRGKNAWNILNEYLQKKSVFATTDGNSNILLFRGAFGNTEQSLFHTLSNPELNNVKSGSETKDHRDRFNTISVISQSEPTISFDNFEDQGGETFKAVDYNIRSTRKLEILADNSLTSEECNQLAKFNTNIRQARGVVYTYVVQGFRQSENGNLWLPNYLVRTKDDFFGIDDKFLIKSVEFTKNLNEGTITRLELVDKDSYTITEPQPTADNNIIDLNF